MCAAFDNNPVGPGVQRIGDGVCLDSQHEAGRVTPVVLHALGFGLNRLVAHPDPGFLEYATQLHAEGIRLAVVLARESFSETPDYASESAVYAQQLADLAPVWVLGNEMDAYLLSEPSPSSWTMETVAYAVIAGEMAAGIRSVIPGATRVMGGLVSGQPDWPRDALIAGAAAWCDAIDVHPYGKDAAAAAVLLAAYRDAYRLPLVVLEWNQPPDEIPAYLAMLRRATIGSCWFCWSDGMVPGLGLVDSTGEPKAEYAALAHSFAEPVTA